MTDPKVIHKANDALLIERASTDDTAGIIELGNKNNVKQLTDQEKKNGFLLVEFTPSVVESFLTAPGVVVHDNQQKVIAFLLNSKFSEEKSSPVLTATTEAMKHINYSVNGQDKTLYEHNWVFYGPIAVDSAYRGQNIPKKMFDEVIPSLRKEYDVAVTFMDVQNQVSRHLHLNKLRFEQVGHFELNGRSYDVIAYNLKR